MFDVSRIQYGVTLLSSKEVLELARSAINEGRASDQLDVFFGDKPHKGGSSQKLALNFTEIVDGQLHGQLDAQGNIVHFWLDNPDFATFCVFPRMERSS